MTPRFGSIFSGGGLVEAGIRDLVTLCFAVEHDAAIAEVYRANFGDHIIVAAAQDVDLSTLPPVDILWASPPCQAHSVARAGNLAKRTDDTVGLCILDYVDACAPRAVIMENVEGYARHPVYHAIIAGLMTRGYWCAQEVVNSADYSVPQTRRRLIVRAVKDSLVTPLPAPQPWKGWYQAIEDLIPTLPDSQFAPWQLTRLPVEITGAFVVAGMANNHGDNVTVRAGSEPIQTINAQVGGKQAARALIVSPMDAELFDGERPAPAVMATTHTKGQMPRATLPTGRVVAMTPRALARFQTVPDWYELPTKTGLATKVIGNGVPCALARVLVQSVLENCHD